MNISFLKRHLGILIIILLMCAFLSPYLFTRSWLGINFSYTGGIGETINGLMSPILNILTIFLLYITLKEQFDANKDFKIIELNNRDYQSIQNMLSKIEIDFDKITLVVQEEENERIYFGSRAFIAFKNLMNIRQVLTPPISKDDWIDFRLRVNYLITHLNIILKKNYTNSLKLEEKTLVFNSLEKYIYFLFQLKILLQNYKENIINKSMSEFEILIFDEGIDNHNYIREFEDYRPEI